MNEDIQILNSIATHLMNMKEMDVGFRVENFCFFMYKGRKFKVSVEECK